ncbi:oxidoreductase [Piscinibacter aquaticus]|uniref:Oxidoreductase n=1 Tax=Piscinibacter aquaticus TaxID=392597 RepID=A0A5C6U0W1_9BURK|nr:oxidoreductase [Piscinibacter aquaticus]
MLPLTSLAADGPRLSPIVAGVWRMAYWGWSAQERLRWIEQSVELGVTSFDHADIYGGYSVEALFGEALALASPSLRQRLQIVSKCGIKLVTPARPEHRIKHYDTTAAHIIASAETSLRALGVERLDLLLVHRPDPLMDADEVAGAFAALRDAGKVAHFGASNFAPATFELLASRFPLSTNQIELHPLHRAPFSDGTLDQLQRLRIRPMIWSPLAGGALLSGDGEAERRVQAALARVAGRHGCTAATVAFAWLLRLPSRPLPVAGSRRIEALRDAVAALQLTLSAQDWAEIWQAAAGRELP